MDAFEELNKEAGVIVGGRSMPKARLLQATETLNRYKAGKAKLEQRIVENEKWFRQQHWNNLRENTNVRQTGWLFASIVNKHADFMDNKPEVNVLAREQSDEKTAKAVTAILPVVLQRAGWDETYEEEIWDKLKFGGGIQAVTWDPAAYNGMGDIKISSVEALNLFWEPGIDNIQKSRNVFYVHLVDCDVLRDMYPQIRELQNIGPASLNVTRYAYEENIDTSKSCYVIDWYYKKRSGVKEILHYCRYVDEICLFSSEYEDGYEDGWYRHGQYPFVFDPCFPDKGTPFGFGVIDAMKDTQADIDEANDLLMRNMKQAAKRRFFSRVDGGVNEDEFADYSKDFVHVQGSISEDHIREISSLPLPSGFQTMLDAKINEIKENSFNRDVNSGGTGGTQTASGIAALQEAGSKSSRSMISRTYRAFREVCEQTIELIRQFYDVPRSFRILGEGGEQHYETFDNGGLQAQQAGSAFGVEMGAKEPIFDLDVHVTKQNVWSRTAQNQDVINFYGMGFFDPQNAQKTLAALEVLQLDNKDKLVEVVRKGDLQRQFADQLLPQLLQIAGQIDPQLGAAATQAAAAAGLVDPADAQGGVQNQGSQMLAQQTDVNGQIRQQNSYMDKQRQIANDRSTPR